MNPRSPSRHARSMADQLAAVRTQVEPQQSDLASTVQDDTLMLFPPLLSVDQIHVPDDAPVPAKESSEQKALKSNTEYWLEFEEKIGEYPVAASLVDYMDQNPEMKRQFNGLYLKAQITIKAAQVAYAKEKSALEEREKQATASTHVLSQQVPAAPSGFWFWLGRTAGAVRFSPEPNVPGLVIMIAMVAACFTFGL